MTDRDPARRPTPSEVARELAGIVAGGEATTVLAAAAPLGATTVLPRTTVAPVPPPVSQPVPRSEPRPAPRPASRPVAPPPRRSSLPWVLLLLAIIAALVVGFLVYEQTRTADPVELPTISEDLPAEIRDPLQQLQDAVDVEEPS